MSIFTMPIVSSCLRAIAKCLFKINGWQVKGETPAVKKYVIIVAPHDSNWDFFLMIGAAFLFGLDIKWAGKSELFYWPYGWFFRWFGGFSVRRNKSKNTVDTCAEWFAEHEEFILIIAPEGSRNIHDAWRSGFYFIAKKAQVPLGLAFIDRGKKICGLEKIYHISGDYEKDLAELQAYFQQFRSSS